MIRCLITKGFCLVGSVIQGDCLIVGVALADTQDGYEFAEQTLSFVDIDTKKSYLVGTKKTESPSISNENRQIVFDITKK
jgi:hypothetical protein